MHSTVSTCPHVGARCYPSHPGVTGGDHSPRFTLQIVIIDDDQDYPQTTTPQMFPSSSLLISFTLSVGSFDYGVPICNIPDIKSMQNINKMLEMAE
jgi:hypothetical protein